MQAEYVLIQRTIDTSHHRDMQPGNVGHVCYANILVLYGLRKQLSSEEMNNNNNPKFA